MQNAFLTIFFIAGFLILLVSIKHLFDSEKGIQNRWRGAIHHTIAVAVALCALVVLIALLQLLDLFEREPFSFSAFLDILQFSFVILVSIGLVIFAVLLLAGR
jgi:hypothetical protein